MTVYFCISRLSKSVILQALINKNAEVIVDRLLDICSTSSVLIILQSDHRHELQYHHSRLWKENTTYKDILWGEINFQGYT